MNQQPTDQPKKSVPWMSAFYSLSAAVAGPAYGAMRITSYIEQSGYGTPDEALTAKAQNVAVIVVIVLVSALIAGILNIIFVMKGGRKWTLIPSVLGILVSLACLTWIVTIWMNEVS